jgi:sec-independent protein translocase protein TatA
MSFGITELLIILAIVILLFGTRKIKNLGGDLGGAIKSFRSAVTGDESASKPEADSTSPEQAPPESGTDNESKSSAPNH